MANGVANETKVSPEPKKGQSNENRGERKIVEDAIECEPHLDGLDLREC